MRKLKPHKVDAIEVARTTVPLFLDRNRLDFFATLGLETVRDPTIEGLRKIVASKLKDWRPEVWEEFIAVRASDPDESSTHQVSVSTTRHVEIAFEFYRSERAKKLDGEMVERMHRLDREEHLKEYRGRDYDIVKANLETKTSRHWVPDYFVELPYSDAAWARLCEAERQLRKVREKIFKTVQGKQFVKMLASNDTFGLLPGKRNK